MRRFLFDDREISREDARGVLVRSRECFRAHGYGLWVFFEKGGDSVAGFVGLLGSPEHSASLIFGTRPELWGRGYGLQSTSAILAYAFETLGLARVVADVDEPNSASIRVLEKLGMSRIGRRMVEGRPLLDYEIRRWPKADRSTVARWSTRRRSDCGRQMRKVPAARRMFTLENP
jgi:RimJ/RimL family protein N-acetyltransferase